MDQSTPERSSSSSHKRLSMSFLMTIMVLCAKHANRLSKKLKLNTKKGLHNGGNGGGERFRWNMLSSPLKSPRTKELITTLSNKAMTMVGRNNTGYDGVFKLEKKTTVEMEEEHGVWQREILMGGKCEPLDFSGVIYYDRIGRLLNEVPPRSPRDSPLPKYPTRP